MEITKLLIEKSKTDHIKAFCSIEFNEKIRLNEITILTNDEIVFPSIKGKESMTKEIFSLSEGWKSKLKQILLEIFSKNMTDEDCKEFVFPVTTKDVSISNILVQETKDSYQIMDVVFEQELTISAVYLLRENGAVRVGVPYFNIRENQKVPLVKFLDEEIKQKIKELCHGKEENWGSKKLEEKLSSTEVKSTKVQEGTPIDEKKVPEVVAQSQKETNPKEIREEEKNQMVGKLIEEPHNTVDILQKSQIYTENDKRRIEHNIQEMKKLNLPVNEEMSTVSETMVDMISAEEAFQNMIVNFTLSIFALDFGEKKNDELYDKIYKYLNQEYHLEELLYPSEKKILDEIKAGTCKQINSLTWKIDRVSMLEWILKMKDSIDSQNVCNVKELRKRFIKKGFVEEMKSMLVMRTEEELLEKLDLLLRYEWAIQEAKRTNQELPIRIPKSLVKEHILALNYVLGIIPCVL